MSFTYDIAHLSVFSAGEVNAETTTPEKLNESARDAFIAFWSELTALPRENETKIRLPKAEVKIPREKSIPAEKPKTRWEVFAERKNIKKDKDREKKVYDETVDEWRPRYGYNRANDPTKKWCAEVPNDPNAPCPFEKYEKDKKERVAEQKKREERNRKRARRAIDEQKAVQVSIKGRKNKAQIEKALAVASRPESSASFNQFNKLKNKVGIFENGSSVPKIFNRNPKKGKR